MPPQMRTRSERRQELHAELVELLGSDNVYYEPPESFKMKYPCLVYTRENMSLRRADNKIYSSETEYQITYISRTPDDDFIDAMIDHFGDVSHSRHFVSDKLHHDVFYIYRK